MSKIITIHARDKKVELKYTTTYIFTLKYKKKLKPKEVHCISAAKVIIHNNQKVLALYLPKPIIKTDQDGNADIYSDYEYNEIIREKAFVKDLQEYSDNKRILKLLTHKKNIGLSVEEFFTYNHLKTINELFELIKQKEKLEKGGGF